VNIRETEKKGQSFLGFTGYKYRKGIESVVNSPCSEYSKIEHNSKPISIQETL
jgi:hypothetical protein